MNQPTGPQGHFQGAGLQRNYIPMRAKSPNYGGKFRTFLNKAHGQQPNMPKPMPQMPRPDGVPHPPPPQFPINRHPSPNPSGFHPHPVIGNGDMTVNGLLQSIMGDLGQGMSADQFANLQAGRVPGMEHGDFRQAFGQGGANDSPLKALVQFLTQGQDGTYQLNNADNTGGMEAILRQAIHGANPGMPGAFHFPGVPGGPGGPGMIGGGGHPGGPFPAQNPLMMMLQQRAQGRGRRFPQMMPNQPPVNVLGGGMPQGMMGA